MRCRKPRRYVQSGPRADALVVDTKNSSWNWVHWNATRVAVVVAEVVAVVVTVVESSLPAMTEVVFTVTDGESWALSGWLTAAAMLNTVGVLPAPSMYTVTSAVPAVQTTLALSMSRRPVNSPVPSMASKRAFFML